MENSAAFQEEFRNELNKILSYWEKFTIDKTMEGFMAG